jgi:signal transduction histidine kinase
MDMKRRSQLVFGLLATVWALVVVWQIEEHVRVQEYAKTDLRKGAKRIANALGAFIRGVQFRGAVVSDRLQPVLDEMVNAGTNDPVRSGEVMAVALLNASGDQVASAGRPIDPEQKEIQQAGERWGLRTATFVYPIEGASVAQESVTNPTAPILVPGFPRRENRSTNRLDLTTVTNAEGVVITNAAPRPPRTVRPGDDTQLRRPFWARGLSDVEYQERIKKYELHGLMLTMSTDAVQALGQHDLWLRFIIAFFATVSVIGSGLAWRNLAKSSELQIRLVRASELNSHLKQMNLAAAGLAHETRNPLNIIRGLAQMISKQPDSAAEIQAKSRGIIDEADKVAAQLNEFINYSRPREVRRSKLALGSVVTEVVRALNYDLEEKKIRLEIKGEQISLEADDQLLRQALFNLLLNAAQAVDVGGEIQVLAEKCSASEAMLEVRDNGPGVPPEQRAEVFKPYFTTQKTGTGLGLAVVQQIVLAHGWEIACLSNEPKGARFRITHLKLAV